MRSVTATTIICLTVLIVLFWGNPDISDGIRSALFSIGAKP